MFMSITKLADPKKKITKSSPGTSPLFKHFRTQLVKDKHTGVEELVVEMNRAPLRDICRQYLNLEGLYDDVPKIHATMLFDCIDRLRQAARREKSAAVEELLKLLELENKQALSRLQNQLDKGVISFGLLSHLFNSGTEIVVMNDEPLAGVVTDTRYRQSLFGDYLEIFFERLESDGNEISTVRDSVRVDAFSGLREVNRLSVRILDAHWREVLTARGRKYVQVAQGAHYQNYTGQMQIKGWWSWSPLRADGRIMVDIKTYNQFCSRDSDDDSDYNGDVSQDNTVSDDQLWRCSPYILGFSFATKQWGRFSVSRINDIQFRDAAFDQLVLAPEKKELIRSLVVDSSSGFQDIISGKGGGCIFLLHGEPGVGKTLTAEAVSELLHRPLYSVSVGELGVDIESLEKNLRRILDVAQIWNAVILIDEADIFLEKRGHDILRSAMTSVFLRLAEYHQGVLFLTTNRVKEFDPAFYSRISIALRYGNLQAEAREQVWTNLLAAAGIDGLDPAELAEVEINGRQIKTIIRLAQGLARQQGVPVGIQHVNQTLDIGRQFLEDIKA
jgi:hypothetical protein